MNEEEWIVIKLVEEVMPEGYHIVVDNNISQEFNIFSNGNTETPLYSTIHFMHFISYCRGLIEGVESCQKND